ncbi:MAG: hypothetical protein HOH74_20905 [Gemmatimonadetes bacterium]|jgi:plasmid stabilization system protein ParE|nr:hypothetical protein [Gemmatimonadota bacterium]
MKLRYTTQALAQLDEIGDYIRQDNPGAADLVFPKNQDDELHVLAVLNGARSR